MVLIKSRLKNTVFQPLSTSLDILFSSKAATEVLDMRNGVVLEIDDEEDSLVEQRVRVLERQRSNDTRESLLVDWIKKGRKDL